MPKTQTPNDAAITVELPKIKREKFNEYCKEIGSNANERLRMHIDLDILAGKKVRIVKPKKQAI